ncbi:hypothetical protein C8F04DRAFT_1258001 [Mycena alexandri]|uniref:Myb/SANT-like domain-containing protein n=1 Tax=Mycena alexandri TaxID=1745969 RepID=A0AAD6SZ14_9AGAR|nr:hypothetical protein C8F04DRAFT_1258001 [Mycena alexandri]
MAPKNQDSARCSWSTADDAVLIDKLRWAKDQGFQSESGWKPQTWAHCAEALKDSPGPKKTADKIQDHFSNAFLWVQKLRGLSGFGWDDGLKLVTASDNVWDALLAKTPKAKHWRKTPFPLYDNILYLVEGIVATGAGAFHAGASQTSTLTQSTQSVSQSTQYDSQADPATQEDTPATPRHSSPGPEGLNLPHGSPNDDLTPSSPIRSRQKRAASPSSASVSNKKRKRNAEDAFEMAGAIERVAMALNTVGSPEVRKRAIRLMEDDSDFSDNEEVDVMRLFTKDTAVAQTYIRSRKKSTRTAFICSILAENDL